MGLTPNQLKEMMRVVTTQEIHTMGGETVLAETVLVFLAAAEGWPLPANAFAQVVRQTCDEYVSKLFYSSPEWEAVSTAPSSDAPAHVWQNYYARVDKAKEAFKNRMKNEVGDQPFVELLLTKIVLSEHQLSYLEPATDPGDALLVTNQLKS